jgi:hypothetical protein
VEQECGLSRDFDELGKRPTDNRKVREEGTAFGGANSDEVDSATEVVFGGEPWIFVVEGHAKKLAWVKDDGKIRNRTGWATAKIAGLKPGTYLGRNTVFCYDYA